LVEASSTEPDAPIFRLATSRAFEPDGGLAGAADRGGVPVGHGADLFGA